ncbi:MAG: RluA family pseudouridine synthase [Fretibacterium sp.]|nr:RluA family pseudouridine synthase [Fretibacterium sp.]
MSYNFTLTRDHDGRRLDRTLRSLWPEIPLSAIMRALRKGEIRIDSARVREPGTRLSAGQSLTVPWEAPGSASKQAERAVCRPIPILWRGEGALIVNKPADLLVQPDTKGGDSVITRVWGMITREVEAPASGTNPSPGEGPRPHPAAVHRLDRNTTGVLAVALRGDTLRALEVLFRERRVSKRYLAISVMHAPDGSGAKSKSHGSTLSSGDVWEIDAPLLKDAEANIVCVSREGKSARTRCRCLAADKELSLIEAELLTGRTHQARVHLAHMGCPILGDRKYGDFEANRQWKTVRRPLLHACELTFPDDLPPELSELAGKTFRAPLPPDMQKIINTRGWSAFKEEPETTADQELIFKREGGV